MTLWTIFAIQFCIAISLIAIQYAVNGIDEAHIIHTPAKIMIIELIGITLAPIGGAIGGIIGIIFYAGSLTYYSGDNRSFLDSYPGEKRKLK